MGLFLSSFVVISHPPLTGEGAGTTDLAGAENFSWVFKVLVSGMIYHSHFITKQVIRSYFFVSVKNKKGILARGTQRELSRVSP